VTFALLGSIGFVSGLAGANTKSGVSTSPAVSSFQGCAQSSRTPVDVLVLMDQTQSLQNSPGHVGTDPQGLRTVGLEAALRAMASAHDVDNQVTYDVRMVGFGQGINTESGPGLSSWTPVTDTALPSLYRSAGRIGQVAQGLNGEYTNFLTALRFADTTLAATPQGTCRALLWFTDGALDLSNNGQTFPSGAVERSTMSAICQPFGVADNLVQDNVYTFSVGLTKQTGTRGANALASIASGGIPNYLYRSGPCGANPNEPQSSINSGTFFDTPTAANLIFQMQRLLCTGSQCTPSGRVPCVERSTSCPANTSYPFWVGPGVASFTFDGLAPQITGSFNPELEISDPTTKEAVVVSSTEGRWTCSLPSGSTTPCAIDGVRLEASSLTHGEIRVVGLVGSSTLWHKLDAVYLVPTGTSGEVTQTFFEKAGVNFAFSPTTKATGPCPRPQGFEVYIGCRATGTIALVVAGTSRPFADGGASVTGLQLNLGSTQIPIVVSQPWPVVGSYAVNVPTTDPIGSQPLLLTGTLALLDHGVRRVSIDLSLERQLALVMPPGYPSISWPTTSSVVQVGQHFSTTLKVVGAETGNGGCIAAGGSPLRVHGSSDLRVTHLASTLPKTCINVGRGQPVTYAVTGTLTKGSDGPFTVTLPVQLGSATGSSAIEQPTVVISFRANVPVNVGRSILLLVLLLFAGLIGIVGVAYVVNRITGKFAPLIRVMMRTVPVRFTEATGMLENPDGSPIEFAPLLATDLVNPNEAVQVQSFTRDGLSFRATAGKGPKAWLLGLFTGPKAVVDGGGATLIVGSGTSVEAPSSKPMDVPLNLNRLWIFRLTALEGFEGGGDSEMLGGAAAIRTAQGQLSVLMLAGEGPDDLASVLRGIPGSLREHFAALGGSSESHSLSNGASGGLTSGDGDSPPTAPTIDPSLLDI